MENENMAEIENQEETQTESTEHTEEQSTEEQREQQESQSSEENTEDEEIEITLDGETPSSKENETDEAPEWVKELRVKQRETSKENKELKKKIEELTKAREPKLELGAKPTLESCDYDEDLFEQKLTEYHNKKAQIEQSEIENKKQQEKIEQEWTQKVKNYQDKKTKLGVKDFDDAEFTVQETLNEIQQGIIIGASDNPELLVYAIGKNPQKAAELGKITDPAKFAYELGKLATGIKVNRKPNTKPETKVTGSGSLSGTTDKTLDRLRAEAAKTGDFSKVHAYKKQQRKN